MSHEDLYQCVFDGLPDAMALLDVNGRIEVVNAQWRHFSRANGGCADGYVGWNYLDVCRACEDDGSRELTAALEAVFAGTRDRVAYEYPCHSADTSRWFLLHAGRVEVDGARYGIVAHIDITRRRLAEDRAARRAECDDLTGLLNRGAFRERLGRALRRARRDEACVAVVFIDLDSFKETNDRHGHAAGDAVLQALGQRLGRNLRAEDGLGRYGGDEFVLFAEDTDSAAAASVVERVELALAEPFEFEGTTLRLGGSVGVSCFPQDGQDVDALIFAADAAMYRVKRGRVPRGESPR